ncbi:MAG: ATP-binding protein, partial [Planctomycetes bacterium]|nr:ATP-binding protein [Planctomycetota bacterium]
MDGFQVRDPARPGLSFLFRAPHVGYAPLIPLVLYLVFDLVLSAVRGSRSEFTSFPSTMLYCLIVGAGVRRTGLMRITPEHAARQALDAQPDGLALVDREGAVQYANAAFRRLCGFGEEGTPDRLPLGEALKIRTRGFERLDELALETLPDLLHLQGEAGPPGGERTPVLVTVKKWRDAAGAEAGAILVVRDERPVRRLEAEMIQIERMHGLSSLVSGVAHGLNNPLTAILGFSEMGCRPLPPDRALKYFTHIHGEAQKAHDVIRALQDFVGGPGAGAGSASLNGVAEDLVRVRGPALAERGIAVKTSLAPDLPPVPAEAGKLRQALWNLFENAADAVAEARRPGEITLSTAVEGRTALLRVADTGVGIRPEVLPRIFDPFFTTKPVGKGTGLGLSLAQAFALGAGGGIEVRSEPGKGSVFSMRIPLAPAPAVQPASPAGAARPSVLVLDDDEEWG